MSIRYDDIINHPHHVSRNHPQMSMHDRAAQFSPFAALTGYEAAVGETARLTEQRRELDEQESAELNRRLSFLASKLDEHPEVTIEYFVPDDRKVGGSYVTITGMVEKIFSMERIIAMSDGQVIRIADVQSLDGKIFEE